MHVVEQREPSMEFKKAWSAAGRHIGSQAKDGLSWLRENLNPPMAEHLSFRIGNQLFFVFVEAAEFQFSYGKDLFMKVAKEAAAIPCIMPMQEHLTDYSPKSSNWGLISAIDGREINPLYLVSDDLIEMSDWELHDFGMQVVKSSLADKGKDVFSAQSSLHIDPSMWFEENGMANWVVVRTVRHPEKNATIPVNIDAIADNCRHMGKQGYFASVKVANADDPFDPDAAVNGNFLPLYRGHGMQIGFTGLQEL